MTESDLWVWAEKHGSYELYFEVSEMYRPDATPWTLTFVKNDVEHHFGGSDLSDLFQWATDFIDDRCQANGDPLQ